MVSLAPRLISRQITPESKILQLIGSRIDLRSNDRELFAVLYAVLLCLLSLFTPLTFIDL